MDAQKLTNSDSYGVILLKVSVYTWNKVGQIYLGPRKKHILLIHFGEMFINY